jgi:hypothetical protein
MTKFGMSGIALKTKHKIHGSVGSKSVNSLKVSARKMAIVNVLTVLCDTLFNTNDLLRYEHYEK